MWKLRACSIQNGLLQGVWLIEFKCLVCCSGFIENLSSVWSVAWIQTVLFKGLGVRVKLGLRLWIYRLGVQGLGFRAYGFGFRLGCRVQGLRSRVEGLGFRAQCFGFRVQGFVSQIHRIKQTQKHNKRKHAKQHKKQRFRIRVQGLASRVQGLGLRVGPTQSCCLGFRA